MYQNNKSIQKIINYDVVTKENLKENNPNWPQTLVHPYRILTIGSFAYEKKQTYYLIW